MATTRNRPTPAATHRMRVRLGTPGICSASTVRSGSAMVMSTPSTKQHARDRGSRRLLFICTPMPAPSGSMDMPEPRVNRLMPPTSKRQPNKNSTMSPASMGQTVTDNASTMPAMGSTE